MECTQRLECTQELNGTQSDRQCPEQIGFLGICGTMYPVKKGPNKIGRDPQTCNIVLNLNSVSRQHAVINILNKKNFMLMDLDSANKTKLSGLKNTLELADEQAKIQQKMNELKLEVDNKKTLPAYIPSPLCNGDTVQFGEVFGVFRLLEEENDLPMTQAIDVPDTPLPSKHMSRVNAVTTIPESPDVSDKDDSFIVPSQPKHHQFQSPKTRNYIKPGKTISIQPIGSNKIDNIYWNSSKKSTSLNLDDPCTSLNDSIPEVQSDDKENEVVNNIHELETQAIFPTEKVNESTDSIYTANTQLPNIEPHTADTQILSASNSPSIYIIKTQLPCGSSPSIHNVNTQMPAELSSPSIHNVNTQVPGEFSSPSIHSLETQIPPCVVDNINEQETQLELCAKRDANDDIYSAPTQMYLAEKDNVSDTSNNNNTQTGKDINKSTLNISDEVVLFDEVDNNDLFEQVESQAILSEDIDLPMNRLVETDVDSQFQIVKPKSAKKHMVIESDSDTDCEDIAMLATQKVPEKKVSDDIEMLPTQKIPEKKGDDDTTDCEEELFDEIKIDNVQTKTLLSPKPQVLEDMATQVIELVIPASKIDVDFEDMLTQVIDEDKIENNAITKKYADIDFEDLPTQVLQEDVLFKNQINKKLSIKAMNNDSPFKVPFTSPLKYKKKDVPKTMKPVLDMVESESNNADELFYQNTQDIYEDLCTQKIEPLEEFSSKSKASPSSTEKDKEVEEFVSNLTSQDIRNVVGVDCVDMPVAKLTKTPSDGSTASDVEVTPKKMRPFKFMDTDLPNSQEIKISVTLNSRSIVTESSSESETEINSEDQCTPILFRKKKKQKPDVKLDLIKKFDVEALPSRVITRVRKPTAKIQEPESKTVSGGILKPKFLVEQEGDIDKEIITENISRLKNKNEKAKITKVNETKKDDTKTISLVENCIADAVKRDRSCRKKAEQNMKEKVETKSEKPKSSSTHDKWKRKEPVNIEEARNDSKNQSTLSTISLKRSLDSTVESKDATHSAKTFEIFNSTTKSSIEPKRSARTRKAETNDKTSSESKPTEEKIEKPKRKYTKRQASKPEEKEPSPEKEVRRSRRQRTDKKTEKNEEKHVEIVKKPKPVIKNAIEPVKVKSILKNSSISQDESTVYNTSSGSSSDSSRILKRPALDETHNPNSKRPRTYANNMSLRATPSRILKTQYVLFTAFPYDEVRAKLEMLGAVVVTDLKKSTVVLTKQIRRTFKLLCAVGLGKPIVGPEWVQTCSDTNTIVDPWLHLMKDEMAEKRFQFNLEQSLKGKRNFLKGYNISATPKVMPNAQEMKLIVECSGGTWKEGGSKWVCVTVYDDRHLWPSLRERGAFVVTTEFILAGVLRQKVDIEAYLHK